MSDKQKKPKSTKEIIWIIFCFAVLLYNAFLAYNRHQRDYEETHMTEQELELAVKNKQSILVHSIDDMPDTYTTIYVVPKPEAKHWKRILQYTKSMLCVLVVDKYKDANEIANVLDRISQREEINQIIIDSGIKMHNLNVFSHMEHLEVLKLQRYYSTRDSDENVLSLSFDGAFPALKELEIDNAKLPSLGDIEKLTGLESLDLSSCTDVSDITALSTLTNLKRLDLSCTDVSDITALSTLTNIEILELSHTNVHDISALSDMKHMRELYLDYAFVSDISSLFDMEELEILSVDQNYYHDKDMEQYLIQDITPLSGKHALRELNLYGSMVRDITPLRDCPALEELELSYTPLESPDTLRYLPNLQHVGMYHCDNLFGGDWDKEKAWYDKYRKNLNFEIN